MTPAKAMLPVVVAFTGLALLGVAAYLYTTRAPAPTASPPRAPPGRRRGRRPGPALGGAIGRAAVGRGRPRSRVAVGKKGRRDRCAA